MTAPPPNETPNPPSPAGSSAPPPSAAPAPTEWRVPDTDHRTWARGKTAAEILNITDQLGAALQSQQYQQPQYQAPAPSIDPNQIRDDDYVDGKTVRSMLQQVAQPVVQRFQSVDGQLARFAMERVKDKYSDAFKHYGPEIEALASRIPAEQRNVDNLASVVHLVLGQHVDDERRRAVTEVGSLMDPTGRSYGANGSSAAAPNGRVTESDALPADYRELLKAKGVTDEMVREFCAGQGETIEQWATRARKHNMNIITERSRRVG